MKISIIVAMANNRAIGLNNQMPWHLSADLKHFKNITMGSPIIMGRKTFESIGKALPGRTNIIISRNTSYQQQGCQVYDSIENAIAACQNFAEVFVIGGATLYQSMISKADFIYLTQINKTIDGDTFFPEFNLEQWKEVEREDIKDDSLVDFTYSFIKLEKLSKGALLI